MPPPARAPLAAGVGEVGPAAPAGAAADDADGPGEGPVGLADAAGAAADALAAAVVPFVPAPAVFFPVCASAGAIASTGTNSATQSVFAERIDDPFFFA
jgi:hypothetical protein